VPAKTHEAQEKHTSLASHGCAREGTQVTPRLSLSPTWMFLKP